MEWSASYLVRQKFLATFRDSQIKANKGDLDNNPHLEDLLHCLKLGSCFHRFLIGPHHNRRDFSINVSSVIKCKIRSAWIFSLRVSWLNAQVIIPAISTWCLYLLIPKQCVTRNICDKIFGKKDKTWRVWDLRPLVGYTRSSPQDFVEWLLRQAWSDEWYF